MNFSIQKDNMANPIKLKGFEVFKDIKKAIFVGAHPDDLEGCAGGTICKLAHSGVEVYAILCTAGDIGAITKQISRSELAAIRATETERAAKLLGITKTINLGYPDGELEPSLELRANLANWYRKTGADTLFTFDPFWKHELHPDHRVSGQTALDAVIPSMMPLYHPDQLNGDFTKLGKINRIFLFYPERSEEIDIAVDISKEYNLKLEALLSHESQFPSKSEVSSWLESWNRYTGYRVQASYAEGFRTFRPFPQI